MSRANWAQEKEKLAQQNAALEAELARSKAPRERVDLLLALADRLRSSDADCAKGMMVAARDLARGVDYRQGWANSLADLARLAMGASNLDEVAQLCFEALELLKDQGGCAALANTHLQLGWMYDYLGDYSTAMDWGLKGLEVARKYSTPSIQARLLDLIACIHSQMDDHAEAVETHADAMRMVDQTDDMFTRASILNNSAMTLLYAGNHELALERGLQSLEIGRQLGMRLQVSNQADTVGDILLTMGRLDQAEQVLNEALELAGPQQMDIAYSYVLRNLGRVQVARGNLDAAAAFLQQAIERMEALNTRGELALCHQLMADVEERKGNVSGALQHFKTFFALRETTAGKESARQLAVLKTSFAIQLAQRDAEIERLRNVELQAEIEERKRAQTLLEKLATTDMLTNLTNRYHFFVLAEYEVERAQRYSHALSLLMIDIDMFKRVNDTLGHIAGDQVLVAIGQVIRESLREVDIAGRYGGEEFAILLPETPIESAARAGERLRAVIADLRVNTDAGQVSVTASIGVSGMWEDGQNAPRELAAMLDRADRALYIAKRAGRNASRVYPAT